MVTSGQIIRELSKPGSKSPRIRELARKMSVPESEYREFRAAVHDMLKEGTLIRMRGGKLAPSSGNDSGTGTFYAKRGEGGFVMPSGSTAPLEADSDLPQNLIHGDKVVYRVSAGSSHGKKGRARIIKIVKRPGATIVGILRSSRKWRYIAPDDFHYPPMVPVDSSRSIEATNGQKVVAHIDESSGDDFEPECRITEVLGFPGEPHLDVEALIHTYGLPVKFPKEVEKQAAGFPERIPASELRNRIDFRKQTTITIDPDNAKDFDDAVSIMTLPGGNYELGVHIADVSHYIAEGTPGDFEALQRGTSVYLVDRVIPMLPERLSNDLCSLRPGLDRLTMSCIMEINAHGHVTSSRIVKSVIHSRERLTYNQVQKFFDEGKGFARKPALREALDEMLLLSKLLRKCRLQKGSLDFDLPEPLVTLDKDGRIIDIMPYPRYDSHRLIEEFMLAANVEVAKFAKSNGIPILYRVHAEPDEEKVDNFVENLLEYGYNFNFRGKITAKKLQRVILAVEGKPEERLINELLLRSMKKAVYQPDNIGHFALAFPVYTHFTSPIRRYPDLYVHRAIKNFMENPKARKDFDKARQALPGIGEICSERERLAEEVERESIKVKTIQFISNRIGEAVHGVISGIVGAGFFVELKSLFIDGFVRFADLNDDYYFYDKNHHRAVGRRTGRIYRLGDSLEVFISRVDMESKRVDLSVMPDVISTKRKRRRR